jgi:hypothetical protein
MTTDMLRCHSHNTVLLASFMTYYRIVSMIKHSGTLNAYLSRSPELTSVLVRFVSLNL